MPPIVDMDKCTGCGSCIEVCPAEVLEMREDKTFVAKPDDCTECRACEAACTSEAISFP